MRLMALVSEVSTAQDIDRLGPPGSEPHASVRAAGQSGQLEVPTLPEPDTVVDETPILDPLQAVVLRSSAGSVDAIGTMSGARGVVAEELPDVPSEVIAAAEDPLVRAGARDWF